MTEVKTAGDALVHTRVSLLPEWSAPTHTPEFFDAAPRITLHDTLAEFLGAAREGLFEYTYADAVKLAGHSCPTVAGAYLLAARALSLLYPDATPERGAIRVELRDPQDAGVTGVIANVIGLITGAAAAGGFKGIAGRFVRQGLLRFGVPMQGLVRFTRTDTGASVELDYHAERVPGHPSLRDAMAEALAPDAATADRQRLGELWQARVRAILVEHAGDPGLIEVVQAPR
jgi:hypothetical protein